MLLIVSNVTFTWSGDKVFLLMPALWLIQEGGMANFVQPYLPFVQDYHENR
jgi:hypothetical protein